LAETSATAFYVLLSIKNERPEVGVIRLWPVRLPGKVSQTTVLRVIEILALSGQQPEFHTGSPTGNARGDGLD
jgi:hypothetical protein